MTLRKINDKIKVLNLIKVLIMTNIEVWEKKINKQKSTEINWGLDPKEQMAQLIDRIKADWLFQQWELQLAKNKIKDAIETYNKLINEFEFSDKVPKSQIRLWELYIKTEDYPKAESVLRDFIKVNWSSEDYVKAMFTLAEILYRQYQFDLGSTRPKMLEAKVLYWILWEIESPKDKNIKDKSKMKFNECEIQLAENDFLAVHVYERIEKFRSALTRLKLMKKDYQWNNIILNRINEMYPKIEVLYKKQNEEKEKKQLSQLNRRLSISKKKKEALEKKLTDFESKWVSGLKWDEKKKYEKQLIELKKLIVDLGKSIIFDEERIDEIRQHWYNPDLEPGMPDPDVISWIIPWIDYEIIF